MAKETYIRSRDIVMTDDSIILSSNRTWRTVCFSLAVAIATLLTVMSLTIPIVTTEDHAGFCFLCIFFGVPMILLLYATLVCHIIVDTKNIYHKISPWHVLVYDLSKTTRIVQVMQAVMIQFSDSTYLTLDMSDENFDQVATLLVANFGDKIEYHALPTLLSCAEGC